MSSRSYNISHLKLPTGLSEQKLQCNNDHPTVVDASKRNQASEFSVDKSPVAVHCQLASTSLPDGAVFYLAG